MMSGMWAAVVSRMDYQELNAVEADVSVGRRRGLSLLQVARAEDSTVPFRQLTPICLLPPELLCSVFELVCCITSKDTFTSGDMYRLTTLSLVCRQWHELIVNTPMLWRCIDFSLKERAECMLRRAKSAPITVKLTSNKRPPVPRDELDSALSVLKEVDIGMVQAMHLQGDGKTLDQASRLFKQGSAPLLESLRISRSRSDIYPYPFILGRDTFSSPMPSLRELSIYRCGVVWSNLHPTAFSQLEELNLEKLSITAKTFQNLNNLRTLNITNVFLRDSLDSASPPTAGVFLPRLEKFKLVSPFSQSVSIFDFVTFPCATQITVESEYKLEHRDLMMTFLRRCGLRLDTKDTHRPSISTLAIEAWPRTSYEYTVVLTGWAHAGIDFTSTFQESSISSKFTVSLTSATDDLPVLLDELADKIRLPDLRHLRVNDRGLLSRAHWTTMLAGLSSVDTLSVQAEDPLSFLSALSPNAGETTSPSSSSESLPEGGGLGDVLLPRLRTVALSPLEDGAQSATEALLALHGRILCNPFDVLKLQGHSACAEIARQMFGDLVRVES